MEELNIAVGAMVTFGRYPQSNEDGGDAQQKPITWRVLSQKNDAVLLLSEYSLDAMPYHLAFEDVTWEWCTLRSWLNGYGADCNACHQDFSKAGTSFVSIAFSDSERAMLLTTKLSNDKNKETKVRGGKPTRDVVFLLAIEDMKNEKYGFAREVGALDASRVARNTTYAISRGAYTHKELGSGNWWLRSPGGHENCAANVDDHGFVDRVGDLVVNEKCAVRPAIWVDVSLISK